MRKIAALLLCFCLLLAGSTTVFAQEVSQEGNGGSAVISVTVPDSHKLTVTGSHAQVLIGSVAGDSFDVERLSEPTLLIRPESGYKVTKVTVNGVDVTEQVKGGYFTLTDVYEDKALSVETEAVKPSSDSTHDISGTITDEDGKPVPDMAVDIGGHTGKTDEDGNFTIEDVPDGYYPVTVTDEDGNIIGYTEIEITDGKPGVTQNEDGSYTVTAPEDADLHLEMTATEDGRLTVDKVTDVTPSSKPDDEKSPQTGDNSHITVWIALVLASGAALTGSLLMGGRRKRRRDS